MSRLIKWMDETLYPKHQEHWDNRLFGEILETRIKPDSKCLDFGAGRGNIKQMNFANRASFVAGVDPDTAIFENPFLNEAKLLDLSNPVIPYKSATFDVVFSANVIEHISDPVFTFKEIARVLKPGGYFLAKTPNLTHYMPLIAKATPHRFHQYYNRLRGRDDRDTFPTLYACNTKDAVTKSAQVAGFDIHKICLIEGRPEYLRLTPFTYAIGFLYERLVNASDIFERFRCVLIFELQKPIAQS